MKRDLEYRQLTKAFTHEDSKVNSEFTGVFNAIGKVDLGPFRLKYEKGNADEEELFVEVYDRGTGAFVKLLRIGTDGRVYDEIDDCYLVTEDTHDSLRQLIHFIDEGPANGFATGAYKVSTGGLFPTSIVWYNENSADKKKVIEKLITWTGVNPTVIQWKMYDSSEVLLHTITDTITYSGVVETSRTRAIA